METSANLNDSVDLDVSDNEDAQEFDLSPLKLDWLVLDENCPEKLGICSLPGCRYKDVWRSLVHDIGTLQELKVEDVFCLCTKGELKLYRVPNLLEKLTECGFMVHHYPVEDGQVPAMVELMKIVEDIRLCVMGGRRAIIHCYGGLGRSCIVAACALMVMDEKVDCQEASRRVKDIRGKSAIQSVKQYNFLNEFEELLREYQQAHKDRDTRSISR